MGNISKTTNKKIRICAGNGKPYPESEMVRKGNGYAGYVWYSQEYWDKYLAEMFDDGLEGGMW